MHPAIRTAPSPDPSVALRHLFATMDRLREAETQARKEREDAKLETMQKRGVMPWWIEKE